MSIASLQVRWIQTRLTWWRRLRSWSELCIFSIQLINNRLSCLQMPLFESRSSPASHQSIAPKLGYTIDCVLRPGCSISTQVSLVMYCMYMHSQSLQVMLLLTSSFISYSGLYIYIIDPVAMVMCV